MASAVPFTSTGGRGGAAAVASSCSSSSSSSLVSPPLPPPPPPRQALAQGASLTMQVPRQTYVFREMMMSAQPTMKHLMYKLEAILSDQHTLEYDGASIERSALTDADLVQIQFFNSICIAEANAEAVRFIFASREHGACTCALTPTGQLRMVGYASGYGAALYDASAAQVPSEDGVDAFQAVSIFTTVHDYIETSTHGRYFHVGSTLLPCGTLFLPVWMNAQGMRAFLGQWYTQKIPKAKTEARIAVRQADGESSIRHVLPRAAQPAPSN